jgi:predicted ester cyclase
MSEVDKATLRRIPLEAISQGKLDVIDEVLSADFNDHQPPTHFPPGREGLKAFIAALRAAFPDIRYTMVQEISEGDLVVQHVTASGTMKGDFAGMPATGKHATWDEVHIVRMQGGKAVEHWDVVDEMGMAQQLGLAPAPGVRAA